MSWLDAININAGIRFPLKRSLSAESVHFLFKFLKLVPSNRVGNFKAEEPATGSSTTLILNLDAA